MEADHFRDLEDVAGVGKAHAFSGDRMMVLRWASLGEHMSPSVNDSLPLPLASLSLGSDTGRRVNQMWRDVVGQRGGLVCHDPTNASMPRALPEPTVKKFP